LFQAQVSRPFSFSDSLAASSSRTVSSVRFPDVDDHLFLG